MKNLKTFENWEGRTPAEEGERAAEFDAYMSRNPVDEVTINLRGLTDEALADIMTILREQSEMIDDEMNSIALETIEKFRNSQH